MSDPMAGKGNAIVGSAPIDSNVIASQCIISDHSGKVCLTFEKRVDALEMPPEDARKMGEALLRQAYKAHFGDYPTSTDHSMLTEQLRIRARNRVLQILRSEPPKTEMELVARAAAIVDQIMKMLVK